MKVRILSSLAVVFRSLSECTLVPSTSTMATRFFSNIAMGSNSLLTYTVGFLPATKPIIGTIPVMVTIITTTTQLILMDELGTFSCSFSKKT